MFPGGCLVGMLGDGIHTETTDVSMGRNTWISRSVAIIVMQNAIAIRLKIAWQQNIQHCAFQWHPSVTPGIIVTTQGKKSSRSPCRVSIPGPRLYNRGEHSTGRTWGLNPWSRYW